MKVEYLVLFGLSSMFFLLSFFVGKRVGIDIGKEMGMQHGIEIGTDRGLNMRAETVDELELRSLRDMRGFVEKAVCRLHVENVQLRGFISPHQLNQLKKDNEQKLLETEKLMRHDVK
jgi:hypothetical protein